MFCYLSIVCSVVFFGLIALPSQVSPATITPTKGTFERAALGSNCDPSGSFSVAMGCRTEASGIASTAMGFYTEAGGEYSFAGGSYMKLRDTADHTFVWGRSESAEYVSAADAFLIFPAGTLGKVGVGTKSPQNLIDLGDSQGKKLAVFQKPEGNDFYGFGISSNTLEIYAGVTAVDTDPAMVVKKSTKRIGIGTKSPDYLLEVVGTAGKPGGGSWSNSSDERLKNITGEYTCGLDQVVRLNPVTFYYKKDNQRGLPTGEEYIGFIAQDVQEVFPEAVSEGSDGYLDFNMHPVNVALVNAVKELKAENDSLRQEIRQIKALLGM